MKAALKTLTALALAALAGCTCVQIKDGRGMTYTRASLGGNYASHGVSCTTSSNAVTFTTEGFDNENREAFVAACKSLEAIAESLVKLGGIP